MSKPQRQGLIIKKLVGGLSPSAAFTQADVDASGGVSRDGLMKVLRDQAKMSVDDLELDEIFALMDTDGNGIIDAKEVSLPQD
jgi:Ca2+-binding EF-hand superfamily protein